MAAGVGRPAAGLGPGHPGGGGGIKIGGFGSLPVYLQGGGVAAPLYLFGKYHAHIRAVVG